MTATVWKLYIPDCLVPVEANQMYDTPDDIWDFYDDSWDGEYPNGYSVVWTVITS